VARVLSLPAARTRSPRCPPRAARRVCSSVAGDAVRTQRVEALGGVIRFSLTGPLGVAQDGARPTWGHKAKPHAKRRLRARAQTPVRLANAFTAGRPYKAVPHRTSDTPCRVWSGNCASEGRRQDLRPAAGRRRSPL